MDKTARLQLIRNTVHRRPRLTDKGAEIIEEIRKDEPDLPGIDTAGVLPPDDIASAPSFEVEDESELDTETISPLMREAVHGSRERPLDAVEEVAISA